MIDGIAAQDLTQRDIAELSGGRRYVFECMKDGRWWTFWELQNEIAERWGAFFSENTISARIRDLKKIEYGNHDVQRRTRHGRTYEYRLEV